MSIRIWEELADQKKQVENQRETILNAFKQRKVEDELGMVKAEKMFKPITKLLGKRSKEDKPVPDYDIDDQTRNFKNELPFGEGDYEKEMVYEEDPYEDLKPFMEEEMWVPATEKQVENYQDFKEWLKQHGYESDEASGSKSERSEPSLDQDIIPLPEKPIPGPEEVKAFPDPDPEELGSEVPPGEKQLPQSTPSYSEATKSDKPPKRFISNNKGKPNAKITTKKSKFEGYDVAQAKYHVFKIYTKRAKQILKGGKKAIGQKELGPYEGKSKEEMQAMIDNFKQGQTKTGSGFNALINRLSLGISSIVAGNTSVKLREKIASIAKLLHKQGTLSKEQLKKVLSIK